MHFLLAHSFRKVLSQEFSDRLSLTSQDGFLEQLGQHNPGQVQGQFPPQS